MTKDNFCVAPWMHLHVINDGRAFPCCQTPLEDKHAYGNVRETAIHDILNSTKAKGMRKDMLTGVPLPSSCERCTSKEKHGFGSMRTGMNQKWLPQVQDEVDATHADGTIDNPVIKNWDYRFSNFCNLACPTCGPLFSTQWHADYKKLFPDYPITEKALVDLKDADLFWSDFSKYANHAKEIHIAGGEPFMMPENNKVLTALEQEENYDIAIRYSTNCTVLKQGKENILDRLQKFSYIHLSCSVDAAGDAFEYIRYKGKWDVVLNNLKEIRQSGHNYWIHPTVSILNIFRITELHEELWNADIIPAKRVHYNADGTGAEFHIENYWVDRMHFNPLFVPEYYSMTIMPAHLKEQAADKITTYGKRLEKEHSIPFHGWQALIDFMYQADDSHLYDEFLSKTHNLDKLRGNDFYKINKEFK